MVSALVPGSSCPGLNPDQGHYVVFLGKTLYFHNASLHPGVYMGTGELIAEAVTLRWTSIPSRGGGEILLVASCYRNRDKLRPDGPLSSNADFTYLPTYLPLCCSENGLQEQCKRRDLRKIEGNSSLLQFRATCCGDKILFPQRNFSAKTGISVTRTKLLVQHVPWYVPQSITSGQSQQAQTTQ